MGVSVLDRVLMAEVAIIGIARIHRIGVMGTAILEMDTELAVEVVIRNRP